MALTGLDIYKLLPKTNCGDCGVPTCLAFAMALATKKTSLDKCPHVSEQAKAALAGASAPPIQLVTIGTGENKLEIGNETVLFRHEQTFYHPTGIAVEIADNLPPAEIEKKAKQVESLVFDRVGKKVRIELIAIRGVSNNAETFANACKTVVANSTLALIQISSNPAVQEAGLKITASRKPLIYAADAQNYAAMAELAKKYSCPLGVSGNNLDELADLTPKITALGVKELVINPNSKTQGQLLSDVNQIRRLGLKKTFRPLGFPVIVFPASPAGGPPDGTDRPSPVHSSGYGAADGTMSETLFAATFILKYAGIVVLKGSELWEMLPLVTVRQNIYTDPQKPIQVESKIYPIGKVTDSSPILITTNFSLTYFTVEPEVEGSKVPSYILVVNTEGMSVMTAYAADKLNEKIITKALTDSNIAQQVKHKKVIIPGYVATLSGKLEAESGWEVLVGPREASSLPSYLKNVWK
ncbi:MAG TPA: acetyl-CoA decarbonylase/synthase complex subunit gamma [Planctomycetota bacterium]|nr:acetyl-CoA decarbonylase/synthase complex subunit gamma [Planctomycetota bacterium]